MGFGDTAARVGQLLLVLAGLLTAAYLGRLVAKLARQPTVIAEIAVGLFAGPLVVAVGGRRLLGQLLPADVLGWLTTIGQAALVLFLVGVAHELRIGRRGIRAVSWTVGGALLIPLLCGGLFAVWVLTGGGPAVRGGAPVAALVLFLGVGLSVTAIPVLARILLDRGWLTSPAGQRALTVAVLLDVLTWLLLAVALGLGRHGSGIVLALGTLVAGVATMLLVRRLLGTGPASRFATRVPVLTMVLTAGFAFAVADAVRLGGLTLIFGAVLAGLAIPNGASSQPWQRVVRVLSRLGRTLVPVYFVATGITVFAGGLGAVPLLGVGLAIVLALAGKVLGAYVGGRLDGTSRRLSLQVGVLLSTRGLTELVVLQIGYSAGIISSTLFAVLVIMALVTTALVGPVYAALDRSGPSAAAEHPSRRIFRPIRTPVRTGRAGRDKRRDRTRE